MSIKVGNFDLLNEIINNKINIQTVLDILAKKGIVVSQVEYDQTKQKVIEQFKSEYPELFQKKNSSEENQE